MTLDPVAITALVVAVVAIPVTIWATRRWGNRRAVLTYALESVPLLPGDDQSLLLEVRYLGVPIPDPHLLTVTFRNTGPKDIPSDSFDAGKPIVIRFTAKSYGVTASAGQPDWYAPGPDASSGEAKVELRPRLLKRGQSWSLSMIVQGPVEPVIESPLVETDLKVGSSDIGTPLEVVVQVLGQAVPLPGTVIPWRMLGGK